ncbi:hypothetical protein [Gemella sp. zg-1178]|uniref:hypothetical protein n=1 Tax=Gemella sp. zg-1178 TaxID=2840372 RepID=UPI001C045F73|nr:hypothetical protein [Gemella sp. zg-1178]MBU0279198.1 hypothetical protein [Gemella sp. zg-1178]
MEKLLRELEAKEKLVKEVTEDIARIKEDLMQEMKKEGIDKYLTKGASISYIPSSVSYVFNSRQFRKENSQLYESYLNQERVTNEQIRISRSKS